MSLNLASGEAAYREDDPNDNNSVRIFDAAGNPRPLAEIEREIFAKVYARYPSKSVLVRYLRIGRSTLYRKLHEFGMELRP